MSSWHRKLASTGTFWALPVSFIFLFHTQAWKERCNLTYQKLYTGAPMWMCPANDPVKCASRCIGSWVTIHPGAHGITPRCNRGPEWKSPVVRQSLVYLEKNLSRETWAAFSLQYKYSEKENIWGKTCKMQQLFFFFFAFLTQMHQNSQSKDRNHSSGLH